MAAAVTKKCQDSRYRPILAGLSTSQLFYINCLIMQLTLILITILGVHYVRATIRIFNSNAVVYSAKGIKFDGYVTDMKPHIDGNSLIVLNQHAVWRLNTVTKTKQLIAGSTSESGYAEGVGAAARFNHPRGLVISQNKAIVSDKTNNCIREIDLVSRTTNRLAGVCTNYGSKDGLYSEAHFYLPYGITARKAGFLVADHYNDALRLVEGGVVSTIVRGSPLKRPLNVIDVNGVVYVTTETGVLKVNPESKNIELISGTESTSGFSDGPLTFARYHGIFGIASPSPGILLIADRYNSLMRVMDLTSKKVSSICRGEVGTVDGNGETCELDYPWSISILGNTAYIGEDDGKLRTIAVQSLDTPTSVQQVCPPLNPLIHTLQPGEKMAQLEIAGIKLRLSSGHHEVESTLSTGTRCVTAINVIEVELLTCPTDRTVQLKPDETSSMFKWSMTSLAKDPSDIECLSCPPESLTLPAGIHRIEYKFLYRPTRHPITCSFNIVVIPGPSYSTATSQCESGLRKGRSTAMFNITAPDGRLATFEAPVGSNSLNIKSDAGLCVQMIKVHDKTPIRSSVDLSITYPVVCSKLDTLSWAIVNITLLNHYADLAGACPECDLPSSPRSPVVFCSSDILSVTWKTNIKLPDQQPGAWASAKAVLSSLLLQFQQRQLTLTGRFWQLNLLTASLPFVSPLKGSDGLYLNPGVVSTCPLPEMIYDKADDACYMR